MKSTLKNITKKLSKSAAPKKAAAKKSVAKKPAKKATKRAAVKKAAPKKVAKKAATKKTAKKTVKKSTKKTTKAAANKPMLVCASDAECFWVHNGPVLQDLQHLRDALDEMDEQIFSHHVTNEKNDFADWVEYILQDKDLADALRKSKKTKTARAVVVKRLRYYL